MTILSSQNDSARKLYVDLLDGIPASRDLPLLVVVQHVVPNTLPFFRALSERFEIAAIIPKPNSLELTAQSFLVESGFPVRMLKRENLADGSPLDKLQLPDQTKAAIQSGERKLIVLDVGGYFQPAIQNDATFAASVAGVVEDTENGHVRYQSLFGQRKPRLSFPVFSVARSPLKEPEDFLVGQSITHSAERIIREDNSLLLNKRVLVIGYGKIGKSIASSLFARNVAVSVFDSNPVRRAQALSHGFLVPDREAGIRTADMIFGATGNGSLTLEDLPKLKHHCYVASVTSVDDEFRLGEVLKDFSNTGVDDLAAYHLDGKTVYFLARGNAVNFAHRNSLGPYIYLVAGEIVESIRRIIEGAESAARIQEISADGRAKVASLWLSAFGDT